jgi:hypothetical protein
MLADMPRNLAETRAHRWTEDGPTARLTVVQPTDDETIVSRTFTLAPGETLELNYRVGRLLFAECR